MLFATISRAMSENYLNPYRPTVSTELQEGQELAEVRFRMTNHRLRYGESKYLLHWHGLRLFLGSMVMISASTVIFITALYYGKISFLTSIVITLAAATASYMALVHNAKIAIRENLKRYGMLDGAVCSVSLIDHKIELTTPSGTFVWPAQNMKIYKTRKGHLLCPENLVFLMIPKANESTRAAYKQLIRNVKARSLGKSNAA